MRSFWLLAPVGAVLFSLTFSAISYAESRSRTKTKAEDSATVELFEAMKSGDIEVKVIPKDATEGKVLIENLTKKPLVIRLPEAFAAVPVAAQFGPGLNPGGGVNGLIGGQNGGANQTVGGAFQGGPGGNNNPFGRNGGGNPGIGGPFNGGVFKVEPEKVRKLKITTVCLEHGKPNPNPHIKYELQPIEAYTSNAGTIEMVKMLARGEIDQKRRSSRRLAFRERPHMATVEKQGGREAPQWQGGSLLHGRSHRPRSPDGGGSQSPRTGSRRWKPIQLAGAIEMMVQTKCDDGFQ